MQTISILDLFTADVNEISFVQLTRGPNLVITVGSSAVTVDLGGLSPQEAHDTNRQFLDEIQEHKKMHVLFGSEKTIVVDLTMVSSIGRKGRSSDIVYFVAGGRLHQFIPSADVDDTLKGLLRDWAESRNTAQAS